MLLLLASGVYGGGIYQHTRDQRALIWNSHPRPDEEAAWSGDQDSKRYATGYGTLTWYRVQRAVVTGSHILPSTVPAGSAIVINRYSGKMVLGKFDGPVVNVDANGKMFHSTFANGIRVTDWVEGPLPPTDQWLNEPVSVSRDARTAEPPADVVAAASTPSPVTSTPSPLSSSPPSAAASTRSLVPSTPSPTPSPLSSSPASAAASTRSPVPSTPSPIPSLLSSSPASAAASTRSPVPSTPSPRSSSPAAVETAVKNRMITDFKEQTQSVLSRVGEATGNFHEIDRLDLVQQLPLPVSESVSSLVDRARDFRAKLGYETALSECRTETETVDALSAIDQITRNIAGKDASAANSRLTDFLKSNPEPMVDNQKPLWRYLTSIRLLCNRLEKEAEIHLQRAQASASAGRTGDAIREYQEAYRAFPNPATAEKTRQLQSNSLGL